MNEILKTLIEAIESNPDQSVETTINEIASKMDITPEDLAEINDAFKTLDSINEKSKDLANSKKSMTRQGWIKKQLDDVARQAGDNAENIISQIEKGVDEGYGNF